MNRLVITLLVFLISTPAWAVENGSSFQTTAPTGTQVPNWTAGWSGSGITGWNYVGQVNGDSAVYLGNGWVITAAHVGVANFVLSGNTYAVVAGSTQTISNSDGTADLVLFQINTTAIDNNATLSLLALVLRSSDPIPFAYGTSGSSVAIIGYGGNEGETWGLNTVTQINELITPQGFTYVSNDFLTLTGTTTYDNPHGSGSKSITNNAQVVSGDSGGGDFIYNAATGQWNLAGINEITGTDTSGQALSGFVQLDTYASQIDAIVDAPIAPTDTPAVPLPGLVVMACLLFFVASGSRRRKAVANPILGGVS